MTTLIQLRLRGHDYDRAGRVVGALLADRPKQEAGKAAVPARPNHEQVGVARLVDQDRCRGTLDNHAFDLNAVWVRHDLVQRGVQCEGGGVAQLAEIAADDRGEAFETRDADIAELPGMDHSQRRLSELRLPERESQCLLGSRHVQRLRGQARRCAILAT